MEKITFTPEGQDSPVDFYVLEQTKLAGVTYILVTDEEEGDGEALILKDLLRSDDSFIENNERELIKEQMKGLVG